MSPASTVCNLPRELDRASRRRLEEANELQLVQGLGGYATSLAALKGWRGLDETLERVGPILLRYLQSRGRTWEAEVVRKRLFAPFDWARHLSLFDGHRDSKSETISSIDQT